MEFENLTPEQKEKLMATKTVEEAMAYIEAEGIDLTKEQL